MSLPGEPRGRRELAYLGLLVVLLVAYAVPLALHQSGRTTQAAELLYENGPYEWAGALACLVGGVLLLATRRNAWTLLLGLATLFLFAEEIAWGQHLLGLAVPEWFVEHNHQGDLTLHNLDLLGMENNTLSDIGVDLLQMYLLALPLLLAAFPTLGSLARRLGVPIPTLSVAFIAGVLKYLNREARERFASGTDPANPHYIGEVFEAGLQLLLLAVAVECWLAAREARSGPNPPVERVPGGPGAG